MAQSMARRGTDPGDDNDLDSLRIPKGSAYVELVCTGNRNTPRRPVELYDPGFRQPRPRTVDRSRSRLATGHQQ